jgi:heterodisulfide reductase subunit A-like polyferredoxin
MKKPKYIPEFRDIPSPRAKMPELPLEDRHLSFEEVDLGLSEEQALAEASRCLSCRRCIGCGLCLAECDDCAVVYEEESAELKLEADALIYAADSDTFDPRSKRELGYADFANVITSIEFERLASATGPFGGVILRPFDGEIPKRIGFIQCVGSREEGIGANFCSTVCCSRTLSQARRARGVIGDVEVTVIHRGLRPVGKDGERILTRLMAEDWMEFVAGVVESVNEDAETGNVRVKYATDEGETEREFDLLVLAVGARARREFGSMARRAGLGTNRYKFVDLKPGTMVSPGGGVYLAGDAFGPATMERGIIESVAAASRALSGIGAGGGEASGKMGTGGDTVSGEAERGGGSDGTRGGKTVVFACRYGLELCGWENAAAEDLKTHGAEVDGIFEFLCYKRGRDAMAQRVGSEDSLVVLGCHPGSHESLFESVLGLPPGRVAIIGKEAISDSRKDLAAAIAAAPERTGRAAAPVEDHTVAVVGGGVAGLAAASELARRGLAAVVVEKSERIGTLLAGAGDNDDERSAVEAFFKGIEENDGIKVMTSAVLESLERQNGNLVLGIAAGEGSETIEASAVIIATGAGEYKPDGLLYGDSDKVMSQKEFRARAEGGETGHKEIVMLQCVGARDEAHPYCSRYCCREAIENALHYLAANSEARATILHRGIRVYGFEEDAFSDAIEKGVEFVEIVGDVSVDGAAGLKIIAKGTDGGEFTLNPDVLVLSLGHTHEGANTELARVTGAKLDHLKFFEVPMPLDAPMNTTERGIFVCGFARAPVTVVEAFSDGLAAAGAACRYIEHGG